MKTGARKHLQPLEFYLTQLNRKSGGPSGACYLTRRCTLSHKGKGLFAWILKGTGSYSLIAPCPFKLSPGSPAISCLDPLPYSLQPI